MLDVPTAAAAALGQAFRYLRHDRVERSLIDRLERGPGHFRLSINYRNVDAFDPATQTIHWDPYSAMRTTKGGRQSPALGLAHEIDHALHDGPRCRGLADTADAAYDNKEERRVICGSEHHAARTLGENVRTDHRGRTYRVATATAR
jgi:hypothetical protein